MNEIVNRIKEVMASVLGTEISAINEDSSSDNLENWDSIRHLNLILSLEEEFDITIPDEEVGDLTTFKLIELTIIELI
jgi:acyl carrier protein